MDKIAFFDFDNTIYKGYTYDTFFDYLSKNYPEYSWVEEKKNEIYNSKLEYNELVIQSANLVGNCVRGWDKTKFHKISKQIFKDSQIYDWVRPVVKLLKSSGFELIIVTGSFDSMIKDVSKMLEFDKIFCSQFESRAGTFTGKISLIMNHESKGRVITEISKRSNDMLSIAFGDSIGDAPMLQLVDIPFIVNAYDQVIVNKASELKWNIVGKSEEIISIIKKYS